MRELPPKWAETPLEEICLRVSKVDPRQQPEDEFTYIDIGGIEGLRIAVTKRLRGLEAPSRARQLVQAGDTVLSTVRTYLRKTALVPPELDGSVASTGFCVLRPASEIDPRYLFHRVTAHDFVSQLSPLQTGSNYPAVRDRDVFAQQIDLPPLNEQRRIVAAIEEHLSRLDAADAALAAALQRLKPLQRQGRSLAVTRGEEHAVGDLLGDIEAGKSFRCHARRADPDEWGVIKVSAMTWGSFDEDENKAVMSEEHVDPRWEIKQGDLLLSRANTTELVGATVLVGSTRPRLLLSDKSMRLHAPEGVDKAWLQLALSSPDSRRQMSAVATGTKDSMRNISQEKVKAVRLRVPPLEEQKRIVAEIEERLGAIDALRAAIERAQRKGAALRRSVLERAFRGELVPQDPSDEPTSVLLDRIRAEREASST